MSSNIMQKNFKYSFLESTAFNECGHVIETVLLPKICKVKTREIQYFVYPLFALSTAATLLGMLSINF